MARWAPGSKGRLEEAALELFSERGFEETTVADIAARAGLTKRTFFRYFADKREVLFAGSQILEDTMIKGVLDAPAEASPLDAVAAGLDASAAVFERIPDRAGRRQALVDAHPELQERERAKLARLSGAVAAALRERGVAEPAAGLAADAGMSILRVAFERWASDPQGQDLRELLRDSLAELRSVTASRAARAPRRR
ncbi:MAG TPA: TetR family transcriptional regulator [Solirubrobacterales bacterium]|nr:TetR family transcriptional regulator [Solirubrobacterales bacterium]